VVSAEKRPLGPLSKDELGEEVRLMFPSGGSDLTPAHEMDDFFFKDYGSQLFRHLRARNGISAESYLASVCGDFQYIEFVSNSKSGQFFFYTYDNQFMIKTVSKTEMLFLISILPQ